jgi:hypothetical protein
MSTLADGLTQGDLAWATCQKHRVLVPFGRQKQAAQLISLELGLSRVREQSPMTIGRYVKFVKVSRPMDIAPLVTLVITCVKTIGSFRQRAKTTIL